MPSLRRRVEWLYNISKYLIWTLFKLPAIIINVLKQHLENEFNIENDKHTSLYRRHFVFLRMSAAIETIVC